MANAAFTRDEVILALDVLYCSGETKLTKNSPVIAELCALLQKLPIYPQESRPDIFRNTVGVSNQIHKYNTMLSKGISCHVGAIFRTVDDEFASDRQQLHRISSAICKNLDFMCSATFGQPAEEDGFPEGALLGHLHRVLENRDGHVPENECRCAICALDVNSLYAGCGTMLQAHLTVPPEDMDAKKRYKPEDFMYVCPNCHAALHRRRPWLTADDSGSLLNN